METSNYIYNLNTLYNAYNSEADVQSKSKLDEETKMLNVLKKLNKAEFNYTYIFLKFWNF